MAKTFKPLNMRSPMIAYIKWRSAHVDASRRYNAIPFEDRKPHHKPEFDEAAKAAREEFMTVCSRLTAWIESAEGKATARTLTPDTVCLMLQDVTSRVPTKKALNGTKVHYDAGEHFPNAYKFMPESTHFKAEFVRGNWYIVQISRGRCPSRWYKGQIEYSEDAKTAIISKASKI